MADLYEIERCVLWYLLLAWELKDEGKLKEARETMKRLQQKELPRFSSDAATLWQGDYVAYLLAYIFDINKDISTVLVQQLLENYHRRLLCKILSEHGDFDALKGISSSQAEEREFINYADRLETAALQAKDKIEDKQKLMQALKAIAGIQAMAGKGEEAVRTAETILTERDLYLPGIASWLVETGERANFKKLLIPCAYYLDAAYQMFGLLARLYPNPEKVEAVAKVVSELNRGGWAGWVRSLFEWEW